MKRLCAIVFFVSALAWAARAQVLLDRIAVTVGKDVITEGDILNEIRITAFMNGERPDFSPQARRTAAERLVDQHLVRNEMNVSGYPEPENSEADKLLAQLKQQRFGGHDALYRAALREYGISEAQLKAHLLWQLAALRFTNFRFQPGIPTVSQALGRRLEAGAEQRASREAAKPTRTSSATSTAPVESPAPRTDESGAATADGNTASPEPSPAAIQQSVDKQLDAWLKQARAQARVTYRPEAFK